MAGVIMAIHNDNQLRAGQFRKATHTEGIRDRRAGRSFCLWSMLPVGLMQRRARAVRTRSET
jgi:hypothetical protein